MKTTKQLWIAFLIAFWVLGCGNSPVSEENSPAVSYGTPNAMAFDNLALIKSLEQINRQDTWLMEISGSVNQDGRLCEGCLWQYIFATRNPPLLYSWEVFQDGRIGEPEKDLPPPKPSVGDNIEQYLKINSSQAVNIARKNGANTYVKKHPNAFISLTYYGWACRIQIEQLGSMCPIFITIRADTGEVLEKDLTCNDR